MADNWQERLRHSRNSIPSQDSGNTTLAIEIQARKILRHVFDASLNGPQLSEAEYCDPRTCPNCGTVTGSTRTPYCSENCREMAGFVRQVRAGILAEWILEPEKQVALGQVLWHLLGGGRPLRLLIAPPRAKEAALKRENYRCEVCGEAATTVDHIGSGCNRPINLRAVCSNCCVDRPFDDPFVTDRPEFSKMIGRIRSRVWAESPIVCCDDPAAWDWRQYLAQRNGIRSEHPS